MLGGCSVYGATKSGVVALTRAMAIEFAQYGIRANAISPGHILTDLTQVTWDHPTRAPWLRERIAMKRPGRAGGHGDPAGLQCFQLHDRPGVPHRRRLSLRRRPLGLRYPVQSLIRFRLLVDKSFRKIEWKNRVARQIAAGPQERMISMYSVNMPTMDSVARFKAAMDSDKGALGPFMIGTDPAFVEAAGYAGYDFVLLDMEHGTTTFQTLPHLIRAANVAGVCPVVRVPRGTDIWIDQALDVGAGAIMIPQIDTAEQARAAVSAAKFSPVGTRGTCRFVRSAGFGAVPGSEYFSKAQDTVVILQAEGRKAVENLDEILDVPGVDVVFVGPYDLSSSLGHVGEIDHPEVVECIKGIIAKANAKGVKLGCFADTVEGGMKWRDLGVKFIGYSCDTYLFMQAAKADVDAFAQKITMS